MEQQIMSPLPIERVKPSPAFFNVGVDYFGPYSIKGEVQQRIRGKGYGVIFTCLFSRADMWIWPTITQQMGSC